MNIIYVIGYPGAGKTTAVTAALNRLGREPTEHTKPLAHVRYGDVWHIGTHRPIFGGTDTLSMSVSPIARKWVNDMADHAALHGRRDRRTPWTLIGEGDRLAHTAFLDDCAAACRRANQGCGRLTVVLLDVPLEIARDRARRRAEQAGRPEQSNAWWKGRATKVQRVAASRPTIRIPATDGPTAIDNLHQLLTS